MGSFNNPVDIGGVFGGNTSQAWAGSLSELLIYASDQTSNRSGIETNINGHYSIY
jgi:hypothetical protein